MGNKYVKSHVKVRYGMEEVGAIYGKGEEVISDRVGGTGYNSGEVRHLYVTLEAVNSLRF